MTGQSADGKDPSVRGGAQRRANCRGVEDERFDDAGAELQIIGGVKREKRKQTIDLLRPYILEGYLLRMKKNNRGERNGMENRRKTKNTRIIFRTRRRRGK
ncbi:MAG: hypothetical protein ACLRSW_13110 [Christensenellaceae bacterium]